MTSPTLEYEPVVVVGTVAVVVIEHICARASQMKNNATDMKERAGVRAAGDYGWRAEAATATCSRRTKV